jgi:tetratricopeptide (TPR) repeat protein
VAKHQRRPSRNTPARVPADRAAGGDPQTDGPWTWSRILLAIGAGALIIRVLYLIELSRTPMWWALVGDSQQYDNWATQIAAGDWFGAHVFYQSPFYPYFLGVVYATIGHSLWAVRILQSLFGAASCVLLATAGREFFDRRVGAVAGILLACYPEAVFSDGLIQKSSIDLLLMTTLLASTGGFARTRRPWMLGVLGLALGALLLNRENALVLVPILMAWLFVAFRAEAPGRRMAWAGIVAAGILVLVLPVAARNYSLSGELLISTSQFGPNFYIGNHAGASGGYEPLVPGRGNAQAERTDATTLAEQAMGRSLLPGEVSAYWFDRAVSDIRQDPWRWTGLLARKAALVVNAREIVDTESMEEDAEYSWVLRATSWFSFGLLLSAGVAGTWLTRGRWRSLWVLHGMAAAFMGSVVLFYVFSRYRFPVVPIMALMAAAALVELSRVPRTWSIWRAPAVLAVLTSVVSFWPLVPPGNVTHLNFGMQLSRLGRPAEAVAWLERAVELVPDDVEARIQLGLVRLDAGATGRAIAELTDVARANPASGPAHAALARALEAGGQREAALRELATVVTVEPDSAPARVNYGVALWNAGQRDAAIEQYRAAVQLKPDDPVGYNNLALALHQAGRIPEAVANYEAALKLKSDYAEAHSNLALLLAEDRHLDTALGHLEAALQLQPANFGIHANLGDLLLRMKRTDEAIQQYQEALADAPNHPEAAAAILERLGDAYAAASRSDEAKGALRRALNLAETAGLTDLAARVRKALTRYDY